MIFYMNIATRQIPFFEGDLRLQFPGTPEELTGENYPVPPGYARVKWVDEPEYDRATQFVKWHVPILIDGVWHLRWRIYDYTDEHYAQIEASIRMRDEELAAKQKAVEEEEARVQRELQERARSTPELIVPPTPLAPADTSSKE